VGQCHGSTSDEEQFAPSLLLLTRGDHSWWRTNALFFFGYGERRFLQGVLGKTSVFNVVFCGEVVVIWW
jgi:hypothetical protein